MLGIDMEARERTRLWRNNNPEKDKGYKKKYVKEHPEKKKAWNNTYRSKNKDKVNEQSRDWGIEHPEQKRENSRRWAKENPERVKVNYNNKRARKKNAQGIHTVKEWKSLCEVTKGYCPNPYNYDKCLGFVGIDKLTEDHKIPLIKGGSNYISNIQPLCKNCNSWKQGRLEEEIKK